MGFFLYDVFWVVILIENLVGIDGFEFVEFVYLDLQVFCDLFVLMGYIYVVNYKMKQVEFWQQGDIIYVINVELDLYVFVFIEKYGFCCLLMVWCVVDVDYVYKYVIFKGVEFYEGLWKIMDVFVIVGIGGLLIYFIDQYYDVNLYNDEFDWIVKVYFGGVGFYYFDYLIYNVFKG